MTCPLTRGFNYLALCFICVPAVKPNPLQQADPGGGVGAYLYTLLLFPLQLRAGFRQIQTFVHMQLVQIFLLFGHATVSFPAGTAAGLFRLPSW